MNDVVTRNRSKFNLIAFFFSASYYAGKGKFGKGIIMAIIGFIPLTAIFTGIYAGIKVNKEFSEEAKYNWKLGLLMFLIHWSVMAYSFKLIKG